MNTHRDFSRSGAVSARWRLCALVLGCVAWTSANADCFDKAAAWQHVNPFVLRAIAWQESHYHGDARNLNTNGSVDYGLMQINTVHLPALSRYGIGKDALMSPCKNVYIAAWLLRQQINTYGNTWTAVGSYHSATPALRDQYAHQIEGILRRWHVLRPEGDKTTGGQRSEVAIKDASNVR
ncbi:lytic transglycosylase domain-containing protein [Paraburkholderia humisilvae]|uniref:Transglycosylase SLT domain-containing protein n=1 Tax=Paraburkholderia humisilvae TaxID=627669 RepID=A0A6J5ECI6_9BURK|nr:lytic transglycosylase domain-containing protein [Paraburkholderia humisilvae]CAB3764320.1 hypothetical protein LMG29542_04853 [Paraburkholderia humisilvae]